MKVKLTKLSNNDNNLRTKEVIGRTDNLPVVGHSFVMISRPLDPAADIRRIETSRVKEVEYDDIGAYTIKTENSTYLIEVLGEEK